MEDAVFRLQHQARHLQEFRRDIAGLWDDNAARQLNQRYLDPHETDAAEINMELQGQYVALEKANEHFAQADQHAIQVENLSFAVAESLAFMRRESATAREFQEHHRAQNVQAKSLIVKVDESIAAASAVCQGVPKV